MSNGSQVHSQVPQVVLTANGKTIVTGQVVGFSVGKLVEVSGYITQTSGAYVPFSRMTNVLPPGKPSDPPQVTVTIDSMELNPEDDVMVIMRVSETWPSVLDQDDPKPSAGIQAAWKPKDLGAKAWSPDVTASGEYGPMPDLPPAPLGG